MRKSDFIFRYRVRNWRDYNLALIRRGGITFWVDEQAVSAWCQENIVHLRDRRRDPANLQNHAITQWS